MPFIQISSYDKPRTYPFFNGHLQTLQPGMRRRVEGVRYRRERLELPDDDFVDLDWIFNQKDQLAILTHGLEGNSQRQYMRGAAKYFSVRNWDILAWNCRSCSGYMNRQLRLYNHGEIEDLHQVIQHVMKKHAYKQIVLLGYSMGGSINLKYASVYSNQAAPISHVAAFSSPTDLKESVRALEERGNLLYKTLFRKRLEYKIGLKAQIFPDQIDTQYFKTIKKWRDFDQQYSAPLNGFDDVEDFYYQASAKHFIPKLNIPSLLVNAINDPIIPTTCSPLELAKHHDYFYLETPKEGGHVGFTIKDDPVSWMEYRAWEFIHQH